MIHALLLVSLAQFLGPNGGLDEMPWAAGPACYSGRVFSDDPNTIGHVYFTGTGIADAKGLSWPMAGTVPQSTLPESTLCSAIGVAGPFSSVNFYSLSNFATNPANFAGSQAFSVCAAWYVGSTVVNQVLANTGNSTSSNGWGLFQGSSNVLFIASNSGGSINLPGIVVGAVNVVCGGWDGSTNDLAKLNLGTTVTTNFSAHPYTPATANNPAIGWLATNNALTGPLLEVWMSTDTPTDALFTSIQTAAKARLPPQGW